MKSARRVARPRSTGSTPSAIGSSVPAWPTRFWPARRRTLATTSCEVQPPCLHTFRTPLCGMLTLLFDGAHQPHDAVAPGERAVEDELQMRDVAQVEPRLQLAVEEARGALQVRLRCLDLVFVTVDAEVDARVAQIRRGLDIGNRDQDAGQGSVLDLATEQISDLLAQQVVDARDATGRHDGSLRCSREVERSSSRESRATSRPLDHPTRTHTRSLANVSSTSPTSMSSHP